MDLVFFCIGYIRFSHSYSRDFFYHLHLNWASNGLSDIDLKACRWLRAANSEWNHYTQSNNYNSNGIDDDAFLNEFRVIVFPTSERGHKILKYYQITIINLILYSLQVFQNFLSQTGNGGGNSEHKCSNTYASVDWNHRWAELVSRIFAAEQNEEAVNKKIIFNVSRIWIFFVMFTYLKNPMTNCAANNPMQIKPSHEWIE